MTEGETPRTRAVRKTTTRTRSTQPKVASKKRVARVASSVSAQPVRAVRTGMSWRIVLLTFVLLVGASLGALYIGYNAAGEINLDQRLTENAGIGIDGAIDETDATSPKPANRPDKPFGGLVPADMPVSQSAPAPAASDSTAPTNDTASTTTEATESAAITPEAAAANETATTTDAAAAEESVEITES